MENNFENFREHLANYVPSQPFASELKMKSDGNIEVYYSPFDAINQDAKVCIVGMSPGRTQAENANVCASRYINSGDTNSLVMEQAKETASFSGALRNNLVALLDYVGLSAHWGLRTAEQLFSSHKHLLHSTSVFRYPVLVHGEPISSAKQGLKTPLLKEMVDTHLSSECEKLSDDVLYIPLGNGTEDILAYLANKGVINQKQILTGFPHPSGANAERLAYFMGKKEKQSLSSKTNSDKLDEMKVGLFKQLSELGVVAPSIRKGTVSTDSIIEKSKPKESKPALAFGNRKKSVKVTTNIKKSDLRSPIDGFMQEGIERQLRTELNEIGLKVEPVKSRKSKELAVSHSDDTLAYISRKTGLKDAQLTVCLHPKYKQSMDRKVELIDKVSIKVGKESRYISSSNYRGFNSKGFSDEINSNEHIAIAYNVDISDSYTALKAFFNECLACK